MPMAHETTEHLVLFTVRGELCPRYSSGKSTQGNRYWCLIALENLAVEKREEMPVTRWVFPREMAPAVFKLVAKAARTAVQIASEEECEAMMRRVVAEAAATRPGAAQPKGDA